MSNLEGCGTTSRRLSPQTLSSPASSATSDWQHNPSQPRRKLNSFSFLPKLGAEVRRKIRTENGKVDSRVVAFSRWRGRFHVESNVRHFWLRWSSPNQTRKRWVQTRLRLQTCAPIRNNEWIFLNLFFEGSRILWVGRHLKGVRDPRFLVIFEKK